MAEPYRRRPPEMRQTMLDRLLTMSGYQTACEITPMDLEGYVAIKQGEAVQEYIGKVDPELAWADTYSRHHYGWPLSAWDDQKRALVIREAMRLLGPKWPST